MKTNNTSKVFSKYAKVYEDKFMEIKLFHDTYDSFLGLLPKNDSAILDIGCGPGNITKYLLDNRPELNVLGIDIADKMLQLAKENNPSANFKLMDCNNIHNIKTSFDGIMCGFCLPYLSKEEVSVFIRSSYQLLNANGILYISTMEDSYENSKYIGPSSGENEAIYTYYYSEGYLKNVLLENGFKISKIVHKKQLNNNIEATDIVLIAQKTIV